MALPSALQIPYRESREGYWGEQTSTLNWCEEVIARPVLEPFFLSLSPSLSLGSSPSHNSLQDYNITFYCAEAVNTLTNLVFMWLGLKGLWNVYAYDHQRVFYLVFLGYMVIGLGSMAFHTTLKCQFSLPPCLPACLCLCLVSAFFLPTLCVCPCCLTRPLLSQTKCNWQTSSP